MDSTYFQSGAPYEAYVGRWSRLVAVEFLNWLERAVGLDWADIGCGTGALSAAILEMCAPKSVVGIDPSAGFVEYATTRMVDPRASFATGDARAIPLADGSVDVVVSGLVLNFVPPAEHLMAVNEMRRIGRPGAVVGAYVWDYAGEMQLMRHFWDAAVALDQAAGERDEANRFPLCHPDALAALFTEAGMDSVETTAIDVPTVFRDFDDYWTPFLHAEAPAPTYAQSLAPDDLAELRAEIRSRLPIAADGSIALIARAWAVRGLV